MQTRAMAVTTQPGQKPQNIFESLRARILSDEWQPGERLPTERELAEHYETNRNTLRETVRRLAQARLVRSRQGQGVTVLDYRRSATVDLIGPFLSHGADATEKLRVLMDMLAPRAHLAELLVRIAAERATDEDVQNLDGFIDQLRTAELAEDRQAHGRAQWQWLDALIDATHSLPNRWMANPFVDALRDILERHPELIALEPSYADYATEVQAAMTTRNPDAAARATRLFHAQVDVQIHERLLPLAQLSRGPK